MHTFVLSIKENTKGLLLVSLLGVISILLGNIISPYLQIEKLTIGIVLGILYTSIWGLKTSLRSGVSFALKKLLKWGIVLLGFKLNFLALAELGPKLVLTVVCLVPLVLFIAQKLGTYMGLNPKLSTLIGAGSSICGASAIVTMSQVIDADDDDSVLAVSIISFLGAIGVIVYSSLALVLNMTDVAYGIWSGLSLQGVAHAIAAAFAKGTQAGEIGTIVKMTRVLMLAPVSLVLATQFRTKENQKRASIPGYVLLFIVAGIVGSAGIIPPKTLSLLTKGSSYFILAAMISMGLIVDLKQIRDKGLKAVIHGIIVFILISIVSYFSIMILL